MSRFPERKQIISSRAPKRLVGLLFALDIALLAPASQSDQLAPQTAPQRIEAVTPAKAPAPTELSKLKTTHSLPDNLLIAAQNKKDNNQQNAADTAVINKRFDTLVQQLPKQTIAYAKRQHYFASAGEFALRQIDSTVTSDYDRSSDEHAITSYDLNHILTGPPALPQVKYFALDSEGVNNTHAPLGTDFFGIRAEIDYTIARNGHRTLQEFEFQTLQTVETQPGLGGDTPVDYLSVVREPAGGFAVDYQDQSNPKYSAAAQQAGFLPENGYHTGQTGVASDIDMAEVNHLVDEYLGIIAS